MGNDNDMIVVYGTLDELVVCIVFVSIVGKECNIRNVVLQLIFEYFIELVLVYSGVDVHPASLIPTVLARYNH